MARTKKRSQPVEVAVIGEVDDWEAEVVKTLLDVPRGGECVFYIDSAGGSVFGALAILTLMRQRRPARAPARRGTARAGLLGGGRTVGQDVTSPLIAPSALRRLALYPSGTSPLFC